MFVGLGRGGHIELDPILSLRFAETFGPATVVFGRLDRVPAVPSQETADERVTVRLEQGRKRESESWPPTALPLPIEVYIAIAIPIPQLRILRMLVSVVEVS